MHFRADSELGVAGIINAARLGHVTLANAVGNGVADDKLLYTYVPDLIRYYLNEEPVLSNVDTWRMDEPDARTEVLDRLDELVLKPVDGSGARASSSDRRRRGEELDARSRSSPIREPGSRSRWWRCPPCRRWSTAASAVRATSTCDPLAVNDGNDVWVLPGGLTRVALPRG